VALHYASKIWKTGKNSDQAIKVLFIDMGQSALTVSIASYDHAKCKLVATTFDENLGGRDFDRLLVDHFAAEFLVCITSFTLFLILLSMTHTLRNVIDCVAQQTGKVQGRYQVKPKSVVSS